MRFFLGAVLVSAATLAATWQAPADRFRIAVGNGIITGNETYRIERSADGVRITGTTTLVRAGAPITMTQAETLAADLSLRHYRLEVTAPSGPQTIDATRAGDSVALHAVANGQTPSKTLPAGALALVLDNLVVSHFQVLLDLAALHPADTAWQIVVPQAFAVLPGALKREGSAAGTLDGKPVQLEKLSLVVGGNLVEVYAEAGTHRLMRAAVPIQHLEMTREGFTSGAGADAAGAPAPSAGPAAYLERPVTFPSAGLEFPGTLTLPAKRAGRVPLLVLVHGSGPNDRDETIGPNKPFRDLAWGLAAHGIATLRYDKRTFVPGFRASLDVRTMTVDQETIDDAVAAAAYARTVPEVDPARVYVLGHSLGAMLAPIIADRVKPAPAGVILLAAAAIALDTTVERQIAARMRTAGQSEAEIAEQVDSLKRAFARVRSGEAPDTEIVFFAPTHYWRDLFARRPLDTLVRLGIPALVLQGGSDFQVTKDDYDVIVAALKPVPRSRWDAHLFPGLNHLFMAVDGTSTGAEYGREGHVDPAVIDTIAAWVARNPR
ncbi:MAG TPA: alpha/beta hydrolase [Gemmatimonadales bacterium]|nr:alpha/beta hydrolase [Gemmatimonadales bacterium]